MKTKILVVDDDLSLRDMLQSALTLSGFDVITAASGDEFRQKVFSQKPDAIILDIILQQEDGTQVYDSLLANGLDPNIPVVFLTALAKDLPPKPPQPNRRYSLLGKPFDSEKLIHQLHELVDPVKK